VIAALSALLAEDEQMHLLQDDCSEHGFMDVEVENGETQSEITAIGLTGTGQQNCNFKVQANCSGNSESEITLSHTTDYGLRCRRARGGRAVVKPSRFLVVTQLSGENWKEKACDIAI
jgi:hypothetical protein